jgi:hypothetical protein
MIIDSKAAEAVYLRPKTETPASAAQKKTQEDFAALVEEASKAAGQGLNASGLASGKAGANTASEFLSSASLAQLQISRLNMKQDGKPSQEEALKQVEETLSLLEDYAIALGDPGTTLKDLSPLAEELSLNAESLNSVSQGLNTGDPLKDISSETASVAAVEALKFKRGDYV